MTRKKTVTNELWAARQSTRALPQTSSLPPWMRRAARAGHDMSEWMDDRPGYPTAHARAVCAACPVQAACRVHALRYAEPWGLWGGLTSRDRVRVRLGMRPESGPPDLLYAGKLGPRKTKPPTD